MIFHQNFDKMMKSKQVLDTVKEKFKRNFSVDGFDQEIIVTLVIHPQKNKGGTFDRIVNVRGTLGNSNELYEHLAQMLDEAHDYGTEYLLRLTPDDGQTSLLADPNFNPKADAQ